MTNAFYRWFYQANSFDRVYLTCGKLLFAPFLFLVSRDKYFFFGTSTDEFNV